LSAGLPAATLPSRTHLLLIPSYNTGPKVLETVCAARAQWEPVWVVVDGSTDGTAQALLALAEGDPGLRVDVLPRNGRIFEACGRPCLPP